MSHRFVLPLVLLLLLACRPGYAAGDQPMQSAGGRVLQVIDPTHVLVSRGKADGLRQDDASLTIHPVRTVPGTKTTVLEMTIRLARARVTHLQDRAATLELSLVTAPVQVGDYFGFVIKAPPELVDDPLFDLCLLDIHLRTLASDKPMVTLADLLAHPEPVFRTAIVQAMVQEIHAQAELAKTVLTDRIEGGRFHGQTLNQAFLATNPADMQAFLDFARAFPGKYMAHDWKLAEVYATWIINRTPTGEHEAAVRRMKPVLDRADRAAGLGHFEEAEAAWREVLKALPADEGVVKKLKVLEEIRTARETLAKDPDDTATRWKLMLRLYDRDAYDLALEQLTRLEKAGYEPESCMRYRGFIAVRRKEYAKAIAIFDAVLARNPKAPVATWREWAVHARQSESDPKSFESAVGLARIAESDKAWDSAVSHYRDALDRARTPEQFATAKAGPERVSVLRELEVQDGWISSDLEKHDLAKARERMEVVAKLCAKVTVPRCVVQRLGTWASTASSWWETGFAIELLHKQVTEEPDQVAARFALAWAQLQRGRWDDARATTVAGLQRAPDSGYGQQILARLELPAGNLAQAQRLAEQAAQDKTYAWPLQVLARVAAVQGRWTEAVAYARKAHGLLPDESDLQDTQDATLRGQAAAAALSVAQPVDAPRQRLRLVRALVALELPDQATRETARIPVNTEAWREARRAVAQTDSMAFSWAERLQAARDAAGTSPMARRRLALLEAHAAGSAPGASVRRARALIDEARFHEALAVLHDVKNGTPEADMVELARRGNQAQKLRNQADDAARRQDYEGALTLLRKSLAEFEAVRVPHGVAGVAFTITWVTSRQGKHQEALAFVTPYLQATRDDGDEMAALDLQRIKANLEGQLGSLDSTRQALETTRATCERLDRSYCLAQVTHDLAELAQNDGRLAQALELAEKAQHLADDVGVTRLQRQALVRLAEINLGSGNLPQCKALAEQLLQISRKDLDADNERNALMYLGAVALKRGDAATARARFAEVYDLGQRIGFTHVRAMARLFEGAAVLDAAHDAKAALPLLLQAATLYASVNDREGQMSAWLKVGRARSQLLEIPGARQALQEANALGKQLQREPFLAGVQTEVALLEARAGRPAEAKAAAKDAVRIADRLEFSDDRWAAHHALGRALEAGKEDAAAVVEYEAAIATVIALLSRSGNDQERESAFGYGRVRDVFRDAIDLLVRTGNVTRALELLELSRDADLRRIFDTNRLHAQDGKLKVALSEMKSAEQQALAAKKALDEEMRKPAEQRSGARVEALSKVAAATDGELRQLLLRLKRDHRQIYALLAVNPESLSELRDSLPPDTLVVEYFIAADAVYAFVLSKDRDKPRAFKVAVTAQEIEQAVFDWRKAVGGQGSVRGGKKTRGSAPLGDEAKGPDAIALSKKLYSWLIAPVEAEMAQAKTTLFVPFGPLYYLPMHALATTDETGKLVYALEKYRIGYLSSTTIFRMLGKQRVREKPTLLAFANPDGSLDGAQAEMERVRTDSFPEARLLIKGDATKKRFFELAGHYRIVHFATHGILAHDALASHLKMAGEPLTVDEITGFEGLEGHTDLVVLSACETAIELGRSTGDEVISIASAFATAGAPALVASLWDVDDQATSELMVSFYAALKQGVDTLEALRQAQLHVMRWEQDGKRPFADPSYWAAFELIGDFR
jgi:CHAT domain-containing protein